MSYLTLYIDPTSPDVLVPLLARLQSLPDTVPVLLRYRSPVDNQVSTSSTGTPLSGWGVEMVLKKMEYSSVDDRARKQGQLGEGEEQEGRASGFESHFFDEKLGPVSWDQNKVPLTEEQLESESGLVEKSQRSLC